MKPPKPTQIDDSTQFKLSVVSKAQYPMECFTLPYTPYQYAQFHTNIFFMLLHLCFDTQFTFLFVENIIRWRLSETNGQDRRGESKGL